MRLRTLSSNVATFRPVTFQRGLNLVIADVTEESLDTDSRNGVGKTSLLQIIDFCLGGSVGENHVLSKAGNKDWAFTLEVEIDDYRLSITREVDDATRVRVAGDLDKADLADGAEGGHRDMSLGQFKATMADRTLGLPEAGISYAPSFRSVVTHSMRWRGDAFNSPFEAFGREKSVQVQVNNGLLLGLDWRLAAERQVLKDRAAKLSRGGKEEADEAGRKLAELDAEYVLLVEQARRLDEQLESFTVLPEYREVEKRANRLTRALQGLANESTLVARQLEIYEEELSDQRSLSIDLVRSLYAEANIVLADTVLRSLDEVERFHRQITRNRRSYLASEVRRLTDEQIERSSRMEALEAERSQDLELLKTSGALDELSLLQARAAEVKTQIQIITERRDDLRSLRSGKSALKRDELDWQDRATQDLDERGPTLSPVVQAFARVFRELYDEDGILIVDVTSNGYSFNVRLPRQGSHGVSKMAVFAYDLSLASASGRPSLGLVAHDSPIFDGVDERQIAKAIVFAESAARTSDFQYIVTINTDDLPKQDLVQLGFDLERATILSLTDQSEEGCLFGIRFA